MAKQEGSTLNVVGGPPIKTKLFPGDVVAEVAARSGMPAAVVSPVVTAFISVVSDRLVAGHNFCLPTVGTIRHYWLEPLCLPRRLQLRFRVRVI
jgi:hypothetical protein